MFGKALEASQLGVQASRSCFRSSLLVPASGLLHRASGPWPRLLLPQPHPVCPSRGPPAYPYSPRRESTAFHTQRKTDDGSLFGHFGPVQATHTGISSVSHTVMSHRALALVSRGTKSQGLSTEEAVKPGLPAYAHAMGCLDISVCL